MDMTYEFLVLNALISIVSFVLNIQPFARSHFQRAIFLPRFNLSYIKLFAMFEKTYFLP